jgi:lipoprotein-anchoring transpeptidase ErfK/SrfK
MIAAKATRKESPMRTHRCPLRSLTLALALAVVGVHATLAAPLGRLSLDAPDRLPPLQLAQADLLRAPDALKPGEFEWQPGWDQDSDAPVVVMVSLDDQRAYVYREGVRIGTSTVSSGKPGHSTPTGTFEILQKKRMHHSNLYEDPRTGRAAAMPWMQRLTWQGVALHAGRVRARPASHGCVRLPPEFAKQLYGITGKGDIVVIARNGSIEALSLAGVDGPLALLLESANALHEIPRSVFAGDERVGANGRGSALTP